MSKSILVIDTPDNCGKCPCFLEIATDCCGVNGKDIDSHGKPDWCPMKDMPKKTIVGIEVCIGNKTECVKSYVGGYNACIDEILKGVNENDKRTV